MPINRLLLGSGLRFDAAGAPQAGRAPAKCQGGALVAGQGKLIGRWTLPDDPLLSSVLGYWRPVAAASDPVVFPTGASPDENLGRVDKWQIDEPALGQLVDAWVVTSDKWGNPFAPAAANALYLGRNRITTVRKTTVAGVGL